MSPIKILITSQKGGVGKSTTSANLAHYFARVRGDTVTLIDFDHQGSSSGWVKKAPVPGLNVSICDVLALRDSGLATLKAKQALRDGCQQSQVVISDLTWVELFPASLLLDYDVVIVPTSMSQVEISSTMNFVRQFASVFNANSARVPRLVLLPSRLSTGENYGDIFEIQNFPVRFALATGLPFCLEAQAIYGKSYLSTIADSSMRESFLTMAQEIGTIADKVQAEKLAEKVTPHLSADVQLRGMGILNKFIARQHASAPGINRPIVVADNTQKYRSVLTKRPILQSPMQPPTATPAIPELPTLKPNWFSGFLKRG